MASTMRHDELGAEYIASLRKIALSAEPYPPGNPMLDTFDIDIASEEWRRVEATYARETLKEYGVPLEEE